MFIVFFRVLVHTSIFFRRNFQISTETFLKRKIPDIISRSEWVQQKNPLKKIKLSVIIIKFYGILQQALEHALVGNFTKFSQITIKMERKQIEETK